MKNVLQILMLTILIFAMTGLSASRAEIPDPADVLEMGIYFASDSTSDDWSDGIVVYNVVDPDTIAAMLYGIEPVLRDCSDMGAKDDAYIYVKFTDMSRTVYRIFGDWSHFSADHRRDDCHWVTPGVRALYIRHSQP